MDLQQPPQADQLPMDIGDWRRHLQPDFRQQVVNKITSILRAYVPHLDEEGLQELQNIAARFESKTFSAACNMKYYMDQISLKMLGMKTRFNAGPSNSAEGPDMRLQVQIQGQSLPTPVASDQSTSQGQQQLNVQNILDDISFARKQTSASSPSANSLAQHSVPNTVLSSNGQGISGTSGCSAVGVDFNGMNPWNQIQGRQDIQLTGPHWQIQQSQIQPQRNCNEQQQLVQQFWNPRLYGDGNLQSIMQLQIQHQSHQNMTAPTRLQSSQKSITQSLSSTQPILNSVLRQQRDQHPMHEKHTEHHSKRLVEQKQYLGSKSGSYGLQSRLQEEVSIQQQTPCASILPSGGGQQHSLQKTVPHMPSKIEHWEQLCVLPQYENSVEHNMQQKIQTSNSLLQQKNMSSQEGAMQTHMEPVEEPSTSFDSTPQTGSSGDWQEEFYQKVKSMSSKALDVSVGDIHSVVNTFDQIAGSAPGSGTRAAGTEDFAAMVEFPLQGRGTVTHYESRGLKRMRHCTSSTAFNAVSSAGSFSGSFMQLTESSTSNSDLAATSDVNRRKIKICPSLLKEINEINERLIDTSVDISEEDVCPDLPASTFEGGIIVKCSYIPVALCPSLKLLYASAHMPPIQPLRLLVPAAYPRCSPILLDKLSPMCSENDLSMKVRSRLSLFLRTCSQPLSLTVIARAWNDCVHSVITEFVQKMGGGTFSSKYGRFEPCSSFT